MPETARRSQMPPEKESPRNEEKPREDAGGGVKIPPLFREHYEAGRLELVKKPTPLDTSSLLKSKEVGQCPQCGGDLATYVFYGEGRGYLIILSCTSGDCPYCKPL